MARFGKNIFLKDCYGNYFRICHILNKKDKYGQYFLKISFPDTRKLPLTEMDHDKNHNVTKEKFFANKVQEFTYHYESGVSHYKNTEAKYFDQKGLVTKITDFPALRLLEYSIYKTDLFYFRDKKSVSSNDFVIPYFFDGKARRLDIVISADPDVRMFADPPAEYIDLYRIDIDDPRANIFISDCYWLQEPIHPITFFEIFRRGNEKEDLFNY